MGFFNLFSGFFFGGLKLGGKGILYIFKYILSYTIPFIQYCAQICFDYLFNFNTIKAYINIDENIWMQTNMTLTYIQKTMPSIKPNNKIFLICLVLYFIITLSIFFNFVTIFFNPNCVYIFFAQNLILLISFIFYNGSEGFFNMLFASNNLQLFVVYFLIMIISLCIPKKFIISIILSVILIIANIFLLANLNFFGDI